MQWVQGSNIFIIVVYLSRMASMVEIYLHRTEHANPYGIARTNARMLNTGSIFLSLENIHINPLSPFIRLSSTLMLAAVS